MKRKVDAPIDGLRRWRILRRDDFTCAYCGSRPGNESLQVDHMISRCCGGSDHDNNLISSCNRCNNGKGYTTAIPRSMCDGTVDRDGWVIWKRFGEWELKWNPDNEGEADCVCLTLQTPFGYEYWIGASRVHEPNWAWHLRKKTWMTLTLLADLCEALDFFETLIVKE